MYLGDGSAQTIVRADQTFYFTQSHYTDTRPTSPSADPTSPGTWQGSHWITNFHVTSMTRPGKTSPRQKREPNPRLALLEADALTTSPARWSLYETETVSRADLGVWCVWLITTPLYACTFFFFFFFFVRCDGCVD